MPLRAAPLAPSVLPGGGGAHLNALYMYVYIYIYIYITCSCVTYIIHVAYTVSNESERVSCEVKKSGGSASDWNPSP